MAPYAMREATEAFWILPLNTRGRLATPGPIVITRGTIAASLVHAREVFAAAVVAHAASVVLVHNHPSGDPTPSPEDYEITRQLVACGVVLDIPVQDHVIVGLGRYISMAEQGILV
jgi:DNA repair protein RadC